MSEKTKYSAEDCLQALRDVAEALGNSPTKSQYEASDVGPSERTIREVLGVSFGEARQLAGLGPPGNNDERTVSLNRDYFETIDTPDRAYWLGTLFGQSSQSEFNNRFSLTISHTVSNRHFVEGFHEAIETEYVVSRYEREDMQDRVQFTISDQTFLGHLHELGLVDSARNVSSLPDIPRDLRKHFVRGFLEVRARLTGSAINFSSKFEQQVELFSEWVSELGVVRTYVGEQQNGTFIFRIGSNMDIAPFFKTCWVDVDDETIICGDIYESMKEDVCTEYPYPENLTFCNSNQNPPGGDGSIDLEDGSKDVASADETGAADDEAEVTMTQGPVDSVDRELTDDNTADYSLSVTVSPTLLLHLLAEATKRGESTGTDDDPGLTLGRIVTGYTRSMIGESYPIVDRESIKGSRSIGLEVSVELTSATRGAMLGLIHDEQSPFGSVDEFVEVALRDAIGETTGGDRNLTVDRSTFEMLEIVGDGDASAAAAHLIEKHVSDMFGG
ncbi:hypothetical protein [Halogranum rubrum]|uniref:Uncharacterized protein n=1 Tax=Halogranum salarium B-1 TaxID=1210908 RepID=J3JDT9_9EURY|nr:hypothetical protein [Halogranum salarium]EJN57779.1 hypothetical protein HSB1_38640 [Halogranum salarium B-1]